MENAVWEEEKHIPVANLATIHQNIKLGHVRLLQED